MAPRLYRYLDLFQTPLIKGELAPMSSLAMDLPKERLGVDDEYTS